MLRLVQVSNFMAAMALEPIQMALVPSIGNLTFLRPNIPALFSDGRHALFEIKIIFYVSDIK